MKIDISFQKPWEYNFKELKSWAWLYKKYTACYGFILRIFGIYINVRDNDASYKIIKAIKEEQNNRYKQ